MLHPKLDVEGVLVRLKVRRLIVYLLVKFRMKESLKNIDRSLSFRDINLGPMPQEYRVRGIHNVRLLAI